jgi:redox-sensitive bicupin YhaK (pirin superfamily)
MMEPRYRDVRSEQIPEVVTEHGTRIKIICGKLAGNEGPVRDIITDPEYLDITVPAASEFSLATRRGHTVFSYVIEGKGYFCKEKKPFSYETQGVNYFDMQTNPIVSNRSLVLFDDGDEIEVSTDADPVRFLLVSGKPIGEPVAWYGPIVMNTQEELRIAFEEYRNGTFIKHK